MTVCLSVAECLEELGLLIQDNGMTVCGTQPHKSLPTLAAQIKDRDNAVRSAALNTMVVVYSYVGEGVYKFTEKVREGEEEGGRGGGRDGGGGDGEGGRGRRWGRREGEEMGREGGGERGRREGGDGRRKEEEGWGRVQFCFI